MTRTKYPRTLHHPSSPGVQSDDKIAGDLSAFEGEGVVITEKMDGENTTLYSDGFHARSLDSGYHASRDWVARLQGEIGHQIPVGWRICAENVYARHAIAYEALPSYVLAFSVWDETNRCLGWDETLEWLELLGLTPVPVLYRGSYAPDVLPDVAQTLDPDRQEGAVMRLARSFAYGDFARSVVKWVRAGHVQTETHWSKAVLTTNTLAHSEVGA